ncbi:GNAT family N-acetyltransferase [Saccharopolyspora spinosa]|uniref:UDP-N-acetylglucosamine transferase subunit ALG13 n=1 Tax=Saccharopolyspora spinosa TaxID=60894 RepID=A0A2N3XZD0_SACSN|nr:GNAT family N-acetyltransferase [Saccharopolyspora spinosa]PKW16035.1 UDP-N-acetylglucosamine transferase subunit ALG13 [Saccharopolyspora spinosa]
MTTLFVATTGGHLAQLHSLSERIPADGPAVWVTSRNEQSTSMLADRDVVYVPPVGGRSVPGVLRCLPIAHRLWRARGITRAISTGSGIALGFLPYLAARGVECHYVESAARVNSPSLTGRLLRWVPRVRVYTQYPQAAGRGWRHGGSQFDVYRATTADRPLGDRLRVVVTVGASAYPFRRMIESLVPLLEPEGALHRATGLPVEVLWQTGPAPVDDLPIQTKPYLPITQLAEALSSADVVISHSGTGSVLLAFDAGKAPVVVTRQRRFGEAIDDHQRQLATELGRRGLVLHREFGQITVDDLLAARSTAVGTLREPPPFQLSRTPAKAAPMRSTTPEIVTVDPRKDSRWAELAAGPHGSVFTSQPWLEAVCQTYGFTPEARIAVDASGAVVGGFAWVRVRDVRGERLCSLPFSDWADPFAPNEAVWHQLTNGVVDQGIPIALRCLRSEAPVRDPRLQEAGRLAWHATRLDVPLPELHQRISATARRNIAAAERNGVRISADTGVEALRDFYRMQVRLRKHKYRMLAQPMEFFENIWEQFHSDDSVVTMTARVGDEPVAAAVFLQWNGVLHFKFGSSLPDRLRLRPNDAIYWAAIRWAVERGLRLVDWGVSDLDQPGLLHFKRKYADDEKQVVALRSPGESSTTRSEVDDLLGAITGLLTDESVSDDITGKAGSLLYRYFC